MNKEKKFFFKQENLKDLQLDESQMGKVFGGTQEISDGTHTRTINYDRYTTYSESTFVKIKVGG